MYLLGAIIAPFVYMYVPSKIMVKGNAAATADNILAHESLFRAAIAGNLIGQVVFVFLVLTLYKLFKPVNERQAKLMGALVIVGSPIAFFENAFKITALMILKGGLKSFEPGQVQDLAAVLLKTGSYSTQMLQVYWGLWLIPFGLLVYQSGFIPRILGISLILNGIAYILLCFTFVLIPDSLALVFRWMMPFLFLGEIPIMFWLLIKGVRGKEESRN